MPHPIRSAQKRQVFQTFFLWYAGLGLDMDPKSYARILDRVPRPVIVFVDNFADALNSVSLILEVLKRQDILFVCAERDYRLGYIEGAFTGEDYLQVNSPLKLTINEARALRQLHQDEGISTIQAISEKRYLREVVGKAIAEANCRIQNNFRTLDGIVADLMRECQPSENSAYLTVSLARYCFSLGVRRSTLSDISDADSIEFLLSDASPLPLRYTDRARSMVVPGNALVGERVLVENKRHGTEALFRAFVDLARK